ncbi:MAG TPA: glycoside hydrolase family 16 protein [Verrucomicrobiae bacterium]|nr:glycoside hydrolase family 16 protein [Verrucomicrobiae bacterium]
MAGSLKNSAVRAAKLAALAFAFLALAALTVPCCAQNSSPPKDNVWKLVWSDEFNGPNGAGVDSSKWVIETGGEGWGNQELESYTDRRQNSFLQDGNLVIRALAEKYTGPDHVARNYTSARMKTLGKFTQTYGRFEARIKVPAGQGMWPAFWMLGDDIDKVGWPACGEIDIMENIGKEPAIVHGSIHGPGYVGNVGLEAPYVLPAGHRFSDDFHLFAIEWTPVSVAFFVDKEMYVKRTPADMRAGWTWVFDKPFFLILNLAVGGDWPGNPDATTVFPKDMLIDYVRVYERSGPETKEPPKN